jgi:YVTN family beta-propeller protein
VAGRERAAERFLTTVLMTDIVGSTEHAAELGDAAWRDLVQLHHALVRAALRRHGGREIDTAGDGFFAVFDAPAAALECALDVAEAVKELGVDIRAGVHVGEVEQVGRKVGGISVPIASRIMAEAAAGEVLASATVRDLATGARLGFEDRGVRQLKGVPGDWRVFAVTRTGVAAASESAAAPESAQRRASAVRRARSRPIWQRRPRAIAAGALALAVVVVGAGLFVLKPWQQPALASIGEDSIGVIDGGRGEIVAAIKVGGRPSAMALDEDVVWIANAGSDTVFRVDVATRTVNREIDVGRGPAGIAVAEGSVWVANSGERTVSRINASTARVVDTVTVGNGPTAVAAGAGAVWVVISGDSTVVRIDPATGAVGKPIAVAAGPVALAVDEAGVWVASGDDAVVTHLDPSSGVTLAAPIALPSRPSAIAVGLGSVWVANRDGTVTRIDPSSNRVIATIDLGGSLTALVATESALWVADRTGYVYRVDPATLSLPPTRVATVSAPETIVPVGPDVWVAARAAVFSHRGGTLRILAAPNDVDPLGFPLANAAALEADGLLGYPRVGGSAGSILVPDLAVAIPRATDGGRTYTFQLRPGLVYSTGDPVLPADFRRAIERSFQVPTGPFGAVGNFFFRSISGTDACAVPDAAPVERCDLSGGIVTDDAAHTVTFRLAQPDPDFLYKTTMTIAYPVPQGVPMNAAVEGAFPGTGPYVVASRSETELRLARNPHFTVWDADVRPDGFPDEIVWTYGLDAEERISRIERGDADFLIARGPGRLSPEQLARVGVQHPGQLHFGSFVVQGLYMNTGRPPFDSLQARQAVSLAIDRAHVADLYGGSPAVAITCQFLPPSWPGYVPYCPYTAQPDPGGRWRGSDLDAARRLVDASGTRGAKVVVGPNSEGFVRLRDHVAGLLGQLGYDVSVDTRTDVEAIDAATDAGQIQIAVSGWIPDFLAPSNFFGWLTCPEKSQPINYCDPGFDALYAEALDLQTTDAAAAIAKWTEVDHAAVDRAIWLPLVLEGSDFVSARVGNYQFHPAYAFLFDQLWVQ